MLLALHFHHGTYPDNTNLVVDSKNEHVTLPSPQIETLAVLPASSWESKLHPDDGWTFTVSRSLQSSRVD